MFFIFLFPEISYGAIHHSKNIFSMVFSMVVWYVVPKEINSEINPKFSKIRYRKRKKAKADVKSFLLCKAAYYSSTLL